VGIELFDARRTQIRWNEEVVCELLRRVNTFDELLEVCKTTHSNCPSCNGQSKPETCRDSVCQEPACLAARAAIAKAEGETNAANEG
jgi:hypothetical protein